MCFFSRKSRGERKTSVNDFSELRNRLDNDHELRSLLPKDFRSPQAGGKFFTADRKDLVDAFEPFYAEQSRGHAILQRRRRLLEIQSSPPSKSDTEGDPPSYFSSLSDDQSRKLQDEILRLTELYWESKRALTSKRAEWDLTKPLLAGLKRMYELTDRHNRSSMWWLERNKCAETGGCCGRTCGCCEKALLSYIRTLENGDRKEVGVYGHCTEECPCCIRVRGRYCPHPQLPQSEF